MTFRVLCNPNREQPYTVWCGPWAVQFCKTRAEADMYVETHR